MFMYYEIELCKRNTFNEYYNCSVKIRLNTNIIQYIAHNTLQYYR